MSVTGVILIGPGMVASALVQQLQEQASSLRQAPTFAHFVLLAVVSRSKQLLADTRSPIPWQAWRDGLEQGQDNNQAALHAHVTSLTALHPVVVVDCTANSAVPSLYPRFLAAGAHVVTPNKHLGAGPLQQYLDTKQSSEPQSNGKFYYEATVGAGLPIFSTLQTLLLTGDRIHKIEGVFSGSLSFIFNFLGTLTLSQAVQQAQAKGYTEPDPRIDLSGMDVARKAVILARECGVHVSLENVIVDNLVPRQLQDVSDADFLQGLPQHDEALSQRVAAAKETGHVLRYVGIVDVAMQTCSVSLQEYDVTHPFAGLAGSDNVFAFHTERYSPNPLVIRGAGAGATVTAMGVLGDMIHAASYRKPP